MGLIPEMAASGSLNEALFEDGQRGRLPAHTVRFTWQLRLRTDEEQWGDPAQVLEAQHPAPGLYHTEVARLRRPTVCQRDTRN